MPYEYSAEHHDWDLTVRAAYNLIMAGHAATRAPDKKSIELEFSFYTGGMLLAFSAVESHMTSVAYQMGRDARFSGFDFSLFKKDQRFWNRLTMVTEALSIQVDKSKGLFHDLLKMQQWRNNLAHSSPQSVETTLIVRTQDSRTLHKKMQDKEYTRKVNEKNANTFYATAIKVIELLEEKSDLKPRSSARYKVLDQT